MCYYSINDILKYFHLNVNVQPIWESGEQREARLEQTRLQHVPMLHV